MAVFEDGLAGTTTTIGTGSYSVTGNMAGYREISQLADGQARVFVIRTPTDFEIGFYTKAGGASPSLARTTIYRTRSGGTSPINWGVGEKTIHSTVSATVLPSLSEDEIHAANVLLRGNRIAFNLNDDSYFYSPDNVSIAANLVNAEILRLVNPGEARCRVLWNDSGAAAGPVFEMLRTSGSPAANDSIGSIWWTGNDSAGNTELWATIQGRILDPISGSEDSSLLFTLMRAGVNYHAMSIENNYVRVHPGLNIDSVGLIVGKYSNGANVLGAEVLSSGVIASCTNSATNLVINRKGSDGELIQFQRDGVSIGSVNVASGVVTYGAFIWSHPGAMADGSVANLPVGTVMVTIDEQWEPDGRRHLSRMAVSSQRGDRRVYGCYAGLNDDGSHMIINAGGAWQALVKGPVAGGDLLWTSDEPGVAELQPDDIVRASTLGKVSISDQREETRLVSCILMAG